MFMRSTVLNFTGKKVALWFITHEFVDGHCPPYVHLASTSHDKCSQASSIFNCFSAPCVILNETEGRRTGRPGNEARELYHKDEEP